MKPTTSIGLKPDASGAVILDGVAEGYEAFAVAAIAEEAAADRPLIYIVCDGQRMPVAIIYSNIFTCFGKKKTDMDQMAALRAAGRADFGFSFPFRPV